MMVNRHIKMGVWAKKSVHTTRDDDPVLRDE